MINLGKTIKKFREKANLTQVQLAHKVDITPTYISALENNRKEPSIALLNKVCQSLNLSKEILFWDALELPDKINKKDKEIITIAKDIVNSYYSTS